MEKLKLKIAEVCLDLFINYSQPTISSAMIQALNNI